MALSKKAKAAAKKRAAAAAKTSFKGKYPGPDVFKGNKSLIARWKKAGSPKVGTAKFAKEFPAKAKKAGGSKSTNTKVSHPQPVAQPQGAGAGASAGGFAAPVADSAGNLVDPAQWENDQYRLQALAEDQAEVDSLNAAQINTEMERRQYASQQDALRGQARLELKKKRDEFNRNKNKDYAKTNNTLAYRGMGRGSAAKRKIGNIVTQHTNFTTDLANQEGKVEKDYRSNTTAFDEQAKAKQAQISQRRQSLAQSASARGLYTK